MTAPHHKGSLLVVDDSSETREFLERHLRTHGYDVISAADAGSALRVLSTAEVDLVITDVKMPGASGLDLVRHVTENHRDTEIMLITGYPSLDNALTAMRSGAQDYLAKPFTREELFAAVDRVMERLSERRASSAPAVRSTTGPLGMVGTSDIMQSLYEAISKASSSESPVFITGESGTGKRLTAKAIHYTGLRADAPFVTVQCGALPAELAEAQLFGRIIEDTRAKTELQPGFCHFARGGTLCLEGIAELPYVAQTKIYQLLKEKEFCEVGSTVAHTVDFSLIAVSGRNLQIMVDSGAFREDLLGRLSANSISVPPLRERGDDVQLLARHFLGRFAKEMGKPVPQLSDEALRVFASYVWPGNVAELEDLIYRLVLTVQTPTCEVADLPVYLSRAASVSPGLDRSLAEVEAEHIRNVISSVGGNKTRAAEILGINRKTLREKLRQADDF